MLSSRVYNLYSTEYKPTGLTEGSTAALETGSVELLAHSTVDGEVPEARSQGPDVTEGHTGKLTSPKES